MANSAAGNRFNFIYFNDADGLPLGKTRTRPPAGTSTNGGGHRLLMPKSLSPAGRPAPTDTVVTGEDGGVQHRYPFQQDNTTSIAVQVAAQDLEFFAKVQNTPLESVAGGVMGIEDISNLILPDVTYVVQSWARNMAGTMKWSGKIYLNGSLHIQGRDAFTERTGAVYNASFTPNPTGYKTGGITMVDSDGNQIMADSMAFSNYDYPVTLHAFTGDGSETDFPTDYKVVSAATIRALIASSTIGIRGTVEAAVASVASASPFGFTLSSPPASGARGLAVYQFSGT